MAICQTQGPSPGLLLNSSLIPIFGFQNFLFNFDGWTFGHPIMERFS